MSKVNPDILRLKNGIGALYGEVCRQAQDLLVISQHKETCLQVKNPAISGWSPQEHLEHLLLTGRSTVMLIEKALAARPSEATLASLNEKGRQLFDLGFLPRGQTQAPDFAWPRGILTPKLRSQLQRFLRQLADLEGRLEDIAQGRAVEPHPFLGYLRPLEWLQFLCIHQNHHLQILRELCQGQPSCKSPSAG